MSNVEQATAGGLDRGGGEGLPRVDSARTAAAGTDRVSRSEWVWLAAVVAIFLLLGLAVILPGHPLGHDEAVYAQRSLYFATGSPTIGYWNDYRAVGLPLLLAPVASLSATDAALRVVPLLIACGGLVLTWWWSRTLMGARAGVLAAAVLAVSPGYALFASRIYVDVPSAVFGLAAACVLLAAARTNRVRPLVIAVIPLSGAATLARYGAPAILAPALAGVTLYRWAAVRRSLPLVVTVGALSAALSAAILTISSLTGAQQAPLGAFRARQVAKELPVWSSALDHLRLAPEVLGPLLVWLVPLCLVVLAIQGWRGWVPAGPVLLNLGIAVGFFLMLNASLAQGAAVYVLPMLPFVATLVAGALAPALDRRGGVAVLGVLGVFAACFALWDSGRAAIRDDRGLGRLVQAAEEMREVAEGDCVLMTGSSPQLGWYSRCPSWGYPRSLYKEPQTDDVLAALGAQFRDRGGDLPPDTPVYAVLTEGGKREPLDPSLAALRASAGAPLVEVGAAGDGARQHIEILRLGTEGDLEAVAERARRQSRG